MSMDVKAEQGFRGHRGYHAKEPHPPKPKVHFPATNHSNNAVNTAENISIYLRSSSKKSYKIEVPVKMAIADIKSLAEEKLGIKKQKQLLHLNGKNITDYGHIQLQALNIIHITNKDALIKPEMILKLKVIIINSFTKKSNQGKIYTINADQTVNQLIAQLQKDAETYMKNEQEKPFYFLLQSSRLLAKEKSFYEQDIAENAELICLITKNQLKTRFSNDTEEDIVNDISELLGFDSNIMKTFTNKQQAINSDLQTTQPKEANERYKSNEENIDSNDDKRQRRQSLSSEDYHQEELFNADNPSVPHNFKKKINSQSGLLLKERKVPFAKKIKALKTKRQLDEMLKSQGKDNIFLRQDVIQTKTKVEPETDPQAVALHKPVASIPKVMPVDQRRRIKLEIQKLFDLDGNSQTSDSKIPTIKEEEEPTSPPTEQPPRIQKRKERMDNLRFSMGSRPAFLNGLRIAQNIEIK